MTEILPANAAGIARAAALLRGGGLVAFGTETVYGLGADATNAEAVARIFTAKGRPRFNPLICHYPDAAAAFAHVSANAVAQRLAAALWPGPLTLVLPRRPDCPVALLTGAGLDTLAVRVPAQDTALTLLRAAGRPVAAPSANRSGLVSPTTAAHVLEELGGRIDAVLDSGACAVGVESTVLDLCGAQPVLLRPGGATLEAIEALIGPVAHRPHPLTLVRCATQALKGTGNVPVRSPGMLASHYAPALPVRLQARDLHPNEALLAFGPPLPGAQVTFNLSERGDLTEAAAGLFAGLRWLDAEAARHGLTRIAVMPVPDAGLGRAINDRLRRAAAPRNR
ncbi:MAG TPA: L-threonylcarbamoyladenylate synthase [Acetobacteraceae bacterium]|nr:L-threonylcarbamoyladenylate synthase [Acetobacteraceae bacterium]